MKLIECHISGFGAFKDYKLSFDDGLNVILQPNGWGKTTLAAYIKAMLYGFERKRVRDVNENERLRYKPWGGGKYGGTLDFEFDGHEYRVLREFGATGAGDTLKVLDLGTGKAARFDGEEVGDWVFGLDANAFQKSVFVGQNGFGFDGSTSGLRNRLNALVNEADDVAGLDKAKTTLDNRRKYYKKTGNRGYIADVSKDVARLVDKQKQFDSQIVQMSRLQEHMEQLDADIADSTSRKEELQKRIDAAQAGEKDTAALTAAHDQLVERQRVATEAYHKFVAQAGAVPAEVDLEAARKSMDDLKRLRNDVKEGKEAAETASSSKGQIAAKYAGSVPSKADIDSRRVQVAELAHQMEVIGLSGPASSSEHEALDAVIAADEELLSRTDAVVAGWGVIEEGMKSAERMQREIDAANAKWAERRANIASLKAEADAAASSVPEKADELIERNRKVAAALREAAKDKQSTGASIDGLREQIASVEAELGVIADAPQASEKELEKIDEGVAACKAASSKLSEAKRTLATEEAKSSDLKLARDNAAEVVQKAQASVAEAEVAKAKALSEDAGAKAVQAEASQVKAMSPAPSIACIVIGVVAAIAGFVLGPASAASFAAYAVAAILVIAGLVLLAKKPSGDQEAISKAETAARVAAEALSAAEKKAADASKAKTEAEAASSKAAADYEAQTKAAACAKEAVEEAAEADKEAKESLVGLISSMIPGEHPDPETVVVQAPAFKDRLAEASKKTQRLTDLKAKTASLEANQVTADEAAAKLIASIGLKPTDDFSAAADEASKKAMQAESQQKAASEASARLDKAIAEAAGKSALDLEPFDKEAVLVALGSKECPGMEERTAQVATAQNAAHNFAEELKPLLKAFSVAADDDTAVEVERLAAALAAYRAHKEETAKAAKETEESRKAADALAAGLDNWAKGLGLTGREALTGAALDAMAVDAAAAEKLDWDVQQAAEKVTAASERIQKLDLNLKQFLAKYGMAGADDVAAAIDEIAKRAKRCDELANEASVADDLLTAWEEKNGQQLAAAKQGADNAQVAQIKMILAAVQTDHESQVAERAQTEEKRNAILQGLEGYLSCAQEVRILAQRKQEATSKLFTVQKTAEFLAAARANLDDRYLGGLTNRFNDYTKTWLKGENLDVEVGGDFDVAVCDGGTPHSVASYSTGYQDLLDICLRMALVDTVFESEEPFIVMDDPFVNLDQEKISRAMLLLALLAQKKQIIYFTCHPSRMEGGDDAPAAEFTLPEQKASREMPRARAKREAEERARAQAELVASYHVEPVTQGRAAVQVADRARAITNNMFNVRFAVDPSSGRRGNVFDAHFIDAKGRALCERQNIEVIDGCVVPERLRFCLTTREDSGDTYDLIIHEQDKPEAELAARISYKADISFNTEEFGF